MKKLLFILVFLFGFIETHSQLYFELINMDKNSLTFNIYSENYFELKRCYASNNFKEYDQRTIFQESNEDKYNLYKLGNFVLDINNSFKFGYEIKFDYSILEGNNNKNFHSIVYKIIKNGTLKEIDEENKDVSYSILKKKELTNYIYPIYQDYLKKNYLDSAFYFSKENIDLCNLFPEIYLNNSIYCYFELNQKEQSLVYFNFAFQNNIPENIQKSYEVYFLAANYYFNNDNSKALKYINESVKLNSNYYESYFIRAKIKQEQNDIIGSLKDINRAIELNNKIGKYYDLKSRILYEDEDFVNALKEITKAIELDNQNCLFYMFSGQINLSLKNSKKACEDWSNSGEMGCSDAYELIKENCGKNKKTTTKESTVKTIESAIEKESINTKETKKVNYKPKFRYYGNGSGFAISSDGLIVTNYHVIKNAKEIVIRGIDGDLKFLTKATVISKDEKNDLVILKIDDPSFTSLGNVPINIVQKPIEVGSSIFVLGYPMIDAMGDEIKLTDGKISSRTGYQGDVSTYQISAPIQPGNSGGPLFDEEGNLIGITSSGITSANNVGYAIKTSYLMNMFDALQDYPNLTKTNTISKKKLPEKIKVLQKFIYIIENYQ